MIVQAAIFVFGMSAIWLANDPRPRMRRWGCVMGLIAQPFWYYFAFTTDAWGVFFSSFFYSYAWARGFWHQWLKQS